MSEEQLIRDLSLMLMYLSSWTERKNGAPRFWKGFDFDVLNALEDHDLIEQSRSAKSAYLTDAGVQRARELLERFQAPAYVRVSAGADGESHFEDLEPRLAATGDQSESGELIPSSGILVRRFESDRTNPWHHAPGRYAVFTLCGAVEITVGDGSVRRIGPGTVLIAEDLTGHGHQTRELGPDPRVSIFVPLPEAAADPSE